MDKILSQDEINALFSAMSSDNLDLNESSASAAVEKLAAAPRKVIDYDFHNADRISQDQMRSLHLMHQYFVRNFSSSLSAYLRAFVDVNLLSVDQMSYAEYLRQLPDSTLLSSMGMRPLDGNLAMAMSSSLVFPMIDMLLGGPGTGVVGERSLTEIETNIIEGVIKLCMRDMREAWRPVMEVEFFLENLGTKVQMFQIIAAGETVVAVGMEIKVGETSGMMNICIPSRILKTIRNKFDQQWNVRRQKVTSGEAERLLGMLRTAAMPLSGELRHSLVTVDDLLKVSVGDIIQLNQRVGDPFVLCVGGKPKFQGRVMLRRGKKVFEISKPIHL
jgi:flagellar motor switch protein FliM